MDNIYRISPDVDDKYMVFGKAYDIITFDDWLEVIRGNFVVPKNTTVYQSHGKVLSDFMYTGHMAVLVSPPLPPIPHR